VKTHHLFALLRMIFLEAWFTSNNNNKNRKQGKGWFDNDDDDVIDDHYGQK